MKYANNLSEFALAFEPEPLTGDELDIFYNKNTMPVRMNHEKRSPMKDIYNSCLLVKRQNAHLLLGHRGCGKSTELNSLKRRFEEAGRKISVIKCNLEADILGLTYWDLLVLLGKHLIQIAQETKCKLPATLIKNIDDFWKEKEITVSKSDESEIDIKAGASVSTPKILKIIKIFTELTSELKYGYEKREIIREKVRKSAAQWISYMIETAGMITKHLNGKQPIIIFEDLDKINPPEKAWEIFTDPLSQMPFPVIYTFPISLSYDPMFAQLEASFNNNIHVLPMIKIRTLEGDRYQIGIDNIKDIIGKRADLSLFEEKALHFLIEKTGGMLRDLFHCITIAASLAEGNFPEKITYEDAGSAIKDLRSLLTRRIEVKNIPLLSNIYKGAKSKNLIDDRAMLLKMMQGMVVLEYNGDRWHDLHPIIEEFLISQGELV